MSRRSYDPLTPIVASESGNYHRSRLNTIWLRIFPLGFKTEFIEVFKLAWPAILTSFFQLFLQTISIIMCGHLAKAQLDAAGLANSIINVFGISIGMGMSSACDTFFSQTFGGENKKRVGIYLQRSLIIMNSVAILICCVHINVEPILSNLLGQNPEISKLTADYMLCFLPGVFFDFNFLVLARYLQNQNIVYPPLICASIGNVVNIVSQYVCIHVLNYSYLSSAVCQASSLFVMMALEIVYILTSKVYKNTWDGWKVQDSLQEWGLFFKLAIPGIFMVGLEEWSFEIATFVSGTIDTVQLGIQTILFQLEAISYMIPLGVSIAVNIRVGQHLGAYRPDHAKTAYRVGVALCLMSSTIMANLIISLRNYIPLIFTTETEIVSGVSAVLVLSAGFQYSDGIAATCAGALRGCGRQLIGAIVLFFGYYVISLPIGISLALLTELKIFGMWIGLLVGISLEAVVFLIIVSLTNWQQQCEKAALVAYGENHLKEEEEEAEYTQPNSVSASMSEFTSETENDLQSNEGEPLIGSRTKRRRRRHRSASISHRTAVVAASVDLPDSKTLLTGDQIKRLVCKRLAFAVVIVVAVTVAVFFRVFQVQSCFVMNNATRADYAGILPVCNYTLT